MYLAEKLRIPHLKRARKQKSKTVVTQGHTISYNNRRLGYSEEYISTFLQREDVQQMLPEFPLQSEVHLKRKNFRSLQGETQSYLVLQEKGRKGRRLQAIFDEPEIPNQFPTTEDPNERGRLSVTRVVPYEVLKRRKLIPKKGKHFKPFLTPLHAKFFDWTFQRESYIAGRKSGSQVEYPPHNRVLAQVIPAAIALDTSGEKLLATQRGEGSVDPRLKNQRGNKTIAFVTMGHGDIEDRSLRDTLHREAEEETVFLNHNSGESLPVHGVHHHSSREGRRNFNKNYGIKPLGVIYTPGTELGDAHVAVAFAIRQRNPDVQIVPRPGSQEAHNPHYIDLKGFQSESLPKEGADWNDIIIHKLSRRRRIPGILKAAL